MPRRKLQPVSIDATVLAELARMQATPKARRGILKYAGRRARMLACAGYPVGIDEASILVADAITDTLTGVVSWDRRQPFSDHLRSIIRARTANWLKSARQRRYVSLEALDDCDAFVALPSIESAQPPARPDALFECAHVVRKLYGAIRCRSTQDAHVTALLDAYAVGLERPRDVMQFTGLASAELVNARKRLDRQLARLSDELRSAAVATMRGLTGYSRPADRSCAVALLEDSCTNDGRKPVLENLRR